MQNFNILEHKHIFEMLIYVLIFNICNKKIIELIFGNQSISIINKGDDIWFWGQSIAKTLGS